MLSRHPTDRPVRRWHTRSAKFGLMLPGKNAASTGFSRLAGRVRRLGLPGQIAGTIAAALLGTNLVMIGIAMTLSIFVQGSVYPVYYHIPGITLPPFADQQIGAAILWVCGDFWCYPAVVIAVRRLIARDGSVSTAVDRMLLDRTRRSGPWLQKTR